MLNTDPWSSSRCLTQQVPFLTSSQVRSCCLAQDHTWRIHALGQKGRHRSSQTGLTHYNVIMLGDMLTLCDKKYKDYTHISCWPKIFNHSFNPFHHLSSHGCFFRTRGHEVIEVDYFLMKSSKQKRKHTRVTIKLNHVYSGIRSAWHYIAGYLQTSFSPLNTLWCSNYYCIAPQINMNEFCQYHIPKLLTGTLRLIQNEIHFSDLSLRNRISFMKDNSGWCVTGLFFKKHSHLSSDVLWGPLGTFGAHDMHGLSETGQSETGTQKTKQTHVLRRPEGCLSSQALPSHCWQHVRSSVQCFPTCHRNTVPGGRTTLFISTLLMCSLLMTQRQGSQQLNTNGKKYGLPFLS